MTPGCCKQEPGEELTSLRYARITSSGLRMLKSSGHRRRRRGKCTDQSLHSQSPSSNYGHDSGALQAFPTAEPPGIDKGRAGRAHSLYGEGFVLDDLQTISASGTTLFTSPRQRLGCAGVTSETATVDRSRLAVRPHAREGGPHEKRSMDSVSFSCCLCGHSDRRWRMRSIFS